MADEVSGVSRDDNWAGLYAAHLEEWSARFAAACGERELDAIVIFSGTERPRFRDDNEYPFYAEPYFKAWIPRAMPDAALKIEPGKKPLLISIQGGGFWQAPAPEPDELWSDSFTIKTVRSDSEQLSELVTSGTAAIGEHADASMGFASVNDAALLRSLDFHRALKTPYEAACIESANRIAALGHSAAQALFADAGTNGTSEFALNQAYTGATRQRDAELPYQSIVALNEHASILHYQHLDRAPPDVIRSFLLDAGADYGGYASDVTRTCAHEVDWFQALIRSMDEMQKRLCSGARNGVSFVALNDFAHRLLADVLVDHGIITCSSDEAYEAGLTRTFLPHGLGHLLGLQVHDAGGRMIAPGVPDEEPPDEHPFLRLTRTLEPGFVVTIEPGLYFIPSLLEELKATAAGRVVDWTLVEQLSRCGGIRIEDNVLVTDGEARNLSRPALIEAGIS